MKAALKQTDGTEKREMPNMGKRAIAFCLALLMLLGAGRTALAEAQDSYITIWEKYGEAFPSNAEAEFSLETALGEMNNILRIYNNSDKAELNKHADAQMYVKYATGVLAFDAGKYEDTVTAMTDCKLENRDFRTGYEPETYIAFAQGMILKNRGGYREAIDMLTAVNGLADYTDRRLDALKECREKFRDMKLAEARTAFDKQDYGGAADLCREILDAAILPNDPETLAFLEQVSMSGGIGTVAQEYAITITSAKTKGADSVTLTWEGAPDTYTVSWTTDLVHGGNAQSVTVTGHEYTVTGLYPETVYRFMVEYEGSKSPYKEKKTDDADEFLVVDEDGNLSVMRTGSCAIYDLKGAREDFLDKEISPCEFKKQKKQAAQRDKIIRLADNKKGLILFVFTNYPVLHETLLDREYVLLLHIEGVDTFVRAGRVGDAYVGYNTEDQNPEKPDYNLYVVAYDLLDALAEKQDTEELSGAAYTLDMLLEGKRAGTVSGTLE